MKYVATDAHRAHGPTTEVSFGQPVSMYEVPARADAIAAALAADPSFEAVEPGHHGRAPIDAVHDPGLLDFLAAAWSRFQREVRAQAEVFPDVMMHPALFEDMGRDGSPPHRPTVVEGQLGQWCWETNTPLVEGTYEAARTAVDLALTALDLVNEGDDVAYALCRPPGHHAPRSAYGGYCYFNNAAIVAEQALVAGRDRVAVLDVDYHHGNGTQQLFWERSEVAYASLHGHPDRAYPYFTGAPTETGSGAGLGTTLNVGLAAGTDDDEYLAHLERVLDALDSFGPDLLVVSLGLDTSVGDPLGDLDLTEEGMHRCGRLVGGFGRPTVIVQEGGYDLATVGRDAHRWLRGFSDQ